MKKIQLFFSLLHSLLICFLSTSETNAVAQSDNFHICEIAPNKIAVYGQFLGQLVFNNGDTIGIHDTVTYVKPDYFLAMCDSQGNFLWAKNLYGNHEGNISNVTFGPDLGVDLIADHENNLYICGTFEDSICFGNSNTHLSTYDKAFIAKFDTTGNCIWSKVSDAPAGNAKGVALGVDAANNIYFTGNYSNQFSFDGLPPLNNSSTTNYNIFIVKMDSDGTVQWMERIIDLDSDISQSELAVYDLAVNDAGDFYLVGYYETRSGGHLNFDDLNVFFNASLWPNGIILKGDFNGNSVSMEAITGVSSNGRVATDVVVDGGDRVYVSGVFGNDFNYSGIPSLETMGSGWDHFILSLNPSLSANWAIESAPTDAGPQSKPLGITVDSSGNIYSILRKYGNVYYPPLPPSSYDSSMVFVKHNQDGEGVCMKLSHEPFNDICVSHDQFVYTIGGRVPNLIDGTNPESTIQIRKWDSNCQVIWSEDIEYLAPFVYLGLEEQETPTQLTTYPNPANDQVHVSGFTGALIRYELLSISGTKIEAVENPAIADGILNLSVSELPQGIYLLRCFTENQVYTATLVRN